MGSPVESQRCAVLRPAVAAAAHRLGASAVGLIALSGSPGLDLEVDRVGITYSNGQTLGDPASPVQLSATVRGDRLLPTEPIPPVLARIGIDRDRVERISAAIASVPADAVPVVTTTWALSRLRPARRPAFLQRLEGAAEERPVAWVSVEGVGVAPGIPTLGDRPASGHSIIGLTVLDRSGVRAEAVGRCWSRGRFLSWLAES